MTPDLDKPPSNVHMLPGEGDGRLSTADGDQLPVKTFKRGKDVVLVVMVDVDDEVEAEGLTDAQLEYNSTRGVIRLHGQAVFEDRSLVRFQPEGHPQILQRRSFVRVHSPQAVRLDVGNRDGDGDSDERPVHTIDISGGGMLLNGLETLVPDETVRFSLTLDPHQPPISGWGRVARAGVDGERALCFEGIDEQDRQRLIRFVFDRMRAARARTRGDWM